MRAGTAVSAATASRVPSTAANIHHADGMVIAPTLKSQYSPMPIGIPVTALEAAAAAVLGGLEEDEDDALTAKFRHVLRFTPAIRSAVRS
jgi:hypothetical protein